MRKFLAGVLVGLIPYLVYRGTESWLWHVYNRNVQEDQ